MHFSVTDNDSESEKSHNSQPLSTPQDAHASGANTHDPNSRDSHDLTNDPFTPVAPHRQTSTPSEHNPTTNTHQHSTAPNMHSSLEDMFMSQALMTSHAQDAMTSRDNNNTVMTSSLAAQTNPIDKLYSMQNSYFEAV